MRAHPSMISIPYWAAAIVTGFVAVGYTVIFTKAEEISLLVLKEYPLYFFVLSPLSLLLGWYLVFRVAPAAQGSGVPQVMAAMDLAEVKHKDNLLQRLLQLRIVFVKIISSSLCVLGGGGVGREGPTVQIASITFCWVGKKFQRIWHNFNPETWLVAGGAAGVAAAFNTPLGGIVYAIEELASVHFSKFKAAIISSVIIAGLIAQWLLGPYLFLGYPKLKAFSIPVLVLALFIGGICGISGALFGKLLFWAATKKKQIKNTAYLVGLICISGLAIAATGFYLGADAIGSGKEALLDTLFKGLTLDWRLAVARFVVPVITYICGCAGGIYAPALAAGGTMGYLFAQVTGIVYTNTAALLGMIAFLTGVTRAPFTAFVLVLEMTDRHSAIFPMMTAALFASSFARIVDKHSFYHHMKRQILDSAN